MSSPLDTHNIVLVGPTAVGKTNLSLDIAQTYACEIIGVDSMQIYRYMDIGTAKPSLEERQVAPHHLIDFLNPDEDYQAAKFAVDADKTCQEIRNNTKTPLLVGGTGLYLKAFTEGIFDLKADCSKARVKIETELSAKGSAYLHTRLGQVDPVSAERLHPNDTQRVIRALEIFDTTGIAWPEHIKRQLKLVAKRKESQRILKIGLRIDRQILYERIEQRVDQMLEQGLLAEVEKLLDMGYSAELKSMQSIGYRHMCQYIAGEWDWDEAIRLLIRDTRHYAKRQFTWFGRDRDIQWFAPDDKENVFATIDAFLNDVETGRGET